MPSSVHERLSRALGDRYRLDRELGAGGMATVYLAHDLRHERDVAIKVLHPDLGAALGAERFLTEIKTTAKLQHPHILPLLDSGAADTLLYYVMPYVRGETLRARLDREKQLPIADAVRIAREVAGALDHAHKQGIIHRDIKPENILLQDGSALVADFGIALAVQQAGTQRLTQTGLSLGTPQYMSPEQAMGEKTIDARSDIYALGAVTYEMLTGDPPFSGNTIQAIVARILTEAPGAIRAVRSTVSDDIEAAVIGALAKLPADRPASAEEFARQLQVSPRTNGVPAAFVGASRERTSWRVVVMTVAAIALAWGAFAAGRRRASAAVRTPTVLSLTPSADEEWNDRGYALAAAPDGRRVAIAARKGDWSGILIRSLDSIGSHYLQGTDRATWPFWSPDGRQLGFFADGQLKTIDIASGTVRNLCAATSPMGASWGADNVILFGPEIGAGFYTVTASGGRCEKLALKLPREGTATAMPSFFRDGRHFVLSSTGYAWIGTLGSDSLTLLTEVGGSRAMAAAEDLLLYVPPAESKNRIHAQRVDLRSRRLLGAPVPILERIPSPTGYQPVRLSHSGLLVARQSDGGSGPHRYWRYAASGVGLDSVEGPGGSWGVFAAAHDGQRVATGGFVITVVDRIRGTSTKLVERLSGLPRPNQHPSWSPDDRSIAFVRSGSVAGDSLLVVNVVSGAITHVTGEAKRSRMLSTPSWTPDGRTIVFTYGSGSGAAHAELWSVDVATGERHMLIAEQGDVLVGRVSPDGSLIAYIVERGLEREAFVRPYPGPGVPVRVATNVGRRLEWAPAGRTLYLATRFGSIARVSLGSDGAPLGTASTVLSSRTLGVAPTVDDMEFSVSSRDGSILVDPPGSAVRSILVITNWQLPSGAP